MMYEFRWMVEKWVKHDDYGRPSTVTEKPILQSRYLQHQFVDGKDGFTENSWSEWEDIDTVYIET